MKYVKPDFEEEWNEAIRYPEFRRMGKKMWMYVAKNYYFIESYSNIEDVLGNVDLDFDNLEPEKKQRFMENYNEGVIEIPLVVKFSDDDYDLIAGNTRIAGLVKNGHDPKLWVIDLDNKNTQKLIQQLIRTAHDKIGRTKGREYAPSSEEIEDMINKLFDKHKSEELDEKWSQKYKNSIDCNNPKGFSQRAHCQGRKKRMNENEKLVGGNADKKSLVQIAKKHDAKNYYHIDDMVKSLKKQLDMGMEVEMEHTDDKEKAKEIALDHLWEDPKYYSKLSKIEEGKNSHEHDDDMVIGVAEILKQIEDIKNRKKVFKNMKDKFHKENVEFNEKEFSRMSGLKSGKKDIDETDASSSDSFVRPAFGKTILKKDIHTFHNANLTEIVDAVGFGYDVPFGGDTPRGKKEPLKISGPEGIYKSRAVKDKKFPRYGGPKAVFVKIKEKCKKFPYCNQGDTGALEFIKEDEEIQNIVNEVSKTTGVPKNQLIKIVFNEIKEIFINNEK